MNPKEQLQKLADIVKMMDNQVNKEDFANAFKVILKAVADLKSTNRKEFETMNQVMLSFRNRMEAEMKKDMTASEKKMMDACMAEMGKMMKAHEKSMMKMSENMAQMKDEMEDMRVDEDKLASSILSQVPKQKEIVAEVMSDMSEKEAESALTIKGLREEIKQLKKDISAKGGVRRIYQPYIDRFTSQTNGVTKTFYLKREPLRTDNIEVLGTDFPIILDPTTDFTVTGKALTLTSAVPAPSSGATLIVKYYA